VWETYFAEAYGWATLKDETGFIVFAPTATEGVWEIKHFFVEEKFRRTRSNTRLFRHLVARLREKNAKLIIACVDFAGHSSPERILRIHEKMGFIRYLEEDEKVWSYYSIEGA